MEGADPTVPAFCPLIDVWMLCVCRGGGRAGGEEMVMSATALIVKAFTQVFS